MEMEQNKKIMIGVLGLGLIAAIIYYFMYSSKKAPAPKPAPKGSTPPNTTGGGSTIVYTGGGGMVSTFPITWGSANTNTLEIQSLLNKYYPVTMRDEVGGLSEDGVLGPQTVKAIRSIYPVTGGVIASSYRITQDQYNTIKNGILQAKTGTSTSSTVTNADKSVAQIKAMTSNELKAYIRSKTGVNLGIWYTSSLYEYAWAVSIGADYFYCNTCDGKYYYNVKTSNATTAASMPAGTTYVNDLGGSRKTNK